MGRNYLSIHKHVKEWISNFFPYYLMGVITYPCWDLSWSPIVNLLKEATGVK